MARGWLFCTDRPTYWPDGEVKNYGVPLVLGIIENEGDFAEVINDHILHSSSDHTELIHLFIEGSPDWEAARECGAIMVYSGHLGPTPVSGKFTRFIESRRMVRQVGNKYTVSATVNGERIRVNGILPGSVGE